MFRTHSSPFRVVMLAVCVAVMASVGLSLWTVQLAATANGGLTTASG